MINIQLFNKNQPYNSWIRYFWPSICTSKTVEAFDIVAKIHYNLKLN